MSERKNMGDAPSPTQDLLWPVYEFRPLPGAIGGFGEVYRYTDGQWLLDDGEYDLVFVQDNKVLMVELPYQRNIVWQGLTGHWSAGDRDHPRGNPWHYMLRDGCGDFGGDWGHDKHPNAIAGRQGMSWACSRHGCANGRHVSMKDGDLHIAAGLVRERDTKRALTAPPVLACCYCGEAWEAKRAALAKATGAAQ